MDELNFINTWLGGHRITIQGLKRVLKDRIDTRPVSIVEIGCGGGDNLRAIKRWAGKSNLPVKLTGVDINPECVEYARTNKQNGDIDFVCSDYRTTIFDSRPDIIFSSLFCHHFTDDELVSQLQWMNAHSALGFFVNDLHRHPAAYQSIRFLTKLFSKSYLVKTDAPISVLRGFKRNDWSSLIQKAGIDNFNCQWKWAFRWLITQKHHAR